MSQNARVVKVKITPGVKCLNGIEKGKTQNEPIV